MLLLKTTFSIKNSKFDIILTRCILNDNSMHMMTELFCSGSPCLFFLDSKF